jgi:hypothetical protein
MADLERRGPRCRIMANSRAATPPVDIGRSVTANDGWGLRRDHDRCDILEGGG